MDGYSSCEPDALWDLEKTPLPWADNTFDGIALYHVIEHVHNWWALFSDCARILKPGGYFDVRMPDESASSAITYRDHLNVFSFYSFHGIWGMKRGTNAWATDEEHSVPLGLVAHQRVPHEEFFWMAKWAPWLMNFCANHGRNFIREQRFMFSKMTPEQMDMTEGRRIDFKPIGG